MAGGDDPRFPAARPAELDGRRQRHPVAIVGAGPVGLTLALVLAQRGVRSVVLEASDTYSEGSRALCWSRRSLEILDRLGVADPLSARGYTWNGGRVYWRDEEVYRFTLPGSGRQHFPAFVNLQQYLCSQLGR